METAKGGRVWVWPYEGRQATESGRAWEGDEVGEGEWQDDRLTEARCDGTGVDEEFLGFGAVGDGDGWSLG